MRAVVPKVMIRMHEVLGEIKLNYSGLFFIVLKQSNLCFSVNVTIQSVGGTV